MWKSLSLPGLFLVSLGMNSLLTPFFGDSILNQTKGDMRRSLDGVGKYCFGNLAQADSEACKLFLEKYADVRTDQYLKETRPELDLNIDLSEAYR